MKTQHLVVLIVAALVAVLAALWAGKLHEPEHAPGSGTMLLPALEPKLNDVTAITAQGKDGAQVTLLRGTDSWTVKEKSDYPADTGKVRKLLIGLSESKLIEEKTSNPDYYGELGVADPLQAPAAQPEGEQKDESATEKPATEGGVLLTLKVPLEGKEQVQLIVGNTARGATGTYVRKPDDPQSWLASGDLSVQADPLKWVDLQIMNVPATRIQSVKITHPDGQSLLIDKETRESPNYTVHDVPAKRALKYDSVANPIASVLASLRLDDIATMADHDPAGHDPLVVEYRTFDGLVVTAQSYVDGDEHYAHFTAAFDEDQANKYYVPPKPATPPASDTSATPDAAGDSGADKDNAANGDAPPAGDAAANPPAPAANATPAPDFSAVRTEAETIDTKVQPWVYVIGSYKYEQMNKHVADLLKDEASKAGAKKPSDKH